MNDATKTEESPATELTEMIRLARQAYDTGVSFTGRLDDELARMESEGGKSPVRVESR